MQKLLGIKIHEIKSLNSLGRHDNYKCVCTSQNSLKNIKQKLLELQRERMRGSESNITSGYFNSIIVYERAGMCP